MMSIFLATLLVKFQTNAMSKDQKYILQWVAPEIFKKAFFRCMSEKQKVSLKFFVDLVIRI